MIRKDYEEKIWRITEPAIVSEGMELVCVECLRMKSRWIVRLYIDKQGGVTIDDCALISDRVGDLLAVHDVPREPYTLEVSSPGLDRPLVKVEDFHRFQGETAVIQTACKIDGMRNFKGVLKGCTTDAGGNAMVMIEVAGKLVSLPKEGIARARLEYVWDK